MGYTYSYSGNRKVNGRKQTVLATFENAQFHPNSFTRILTVRDWLNSINKTGWSVTDFADKVLYSTPSFSTDPINDGAVADFHLICMYTLSGKPKQLCVDIENVSSSTEFVYEYERQVDNAVTPVTGGSAKDYQVISAIIYLKRSE